MIKSTEIVSKTLDGAFETLSRQITVMLPQRNAENAMNRINKEPSTVREGIDDGRHKSFDTLDVSKIIDTLDDKEEHTGKTGVVDWKNVKKVKKF